LSCQIFGEGDVMIESNSVTSFSESLSEWAPELARTMVSLGGDIALVIDDQGVVQRVDQRASTPLACDANSWIGHHWTETVTMESKSKVERLMAEASTTCATRKREVNHPARDGATIPVAYTAMRLGSRGPILAVGRDLGISAALQQKFMGAQREMERNYAHARQAEARYRLLFQVATDAVIVVDGVTLNILEANQSASELFDVTPGQVVGQHAAFGFERRSRDVVVAALATALDSGQSTETRAQLMGRINTTSVTATPFSVVDSKQLLVRIRTTEQLGSSSNLGATLARLVDSASDGVAVTDTAGSVLVANPAFLKLVQASTEASVRGRPLSDWISLPNEPFGELLARVGREGMMGFSPSQVLAQDASSKPVEVAATLLSEIDPPCIGFSIRSVPTPCHNMSIAVEPMQADVRVLCDQVGSAALPELMRRASEILQRNFIRMAIERAGADLNKAATMLGINRQQLDMLNQSLSSA
jgi:transcriptional regulator PpsR